MARFRRVLLAALPQVVAVIPALALLVFSAHRLPDPIASHFDASGVADGFASPASTLLTMLYLGVGLALLFGVLSWFLFGSRPPGGPSWDFGRWFVGISWAESAFLGVVLYQAVAANLDLTDAAEAVLPGTMFPLALLAAVVAGIVGGLLAPRTPVSDAEPASVAAVSLGATEQVSWTRSVGAPWLPVLGGLLIALGVGLGVALHPGGGIGAAVAGVAVVLLGSARVTVDRRGLTVALGPFEWPRVRIPADDVADTSVAEVSPGQFGGWGYRIVPGGHGVILRSGEALVVTRRSGRRFTVTVDDAVTAAGLLSAVATRKG
jgi:Protein of unknown function (DUF1648)